MNQPRRLLRLAFIFLALMIITIVTTAIWDGALGASVGMAAQKAAREAPVNVSEVEYRTYLESLPQPRGWVSYTVFATDPASPWWGGKALATVTNPEWESPLMGLLDQFGVLDASGGSFNIGTVGETRYQLSFNRVIPGPLPFFVSICFWLAFWAMLALWLYQDAKSRLGKQALPWLALGLIGGPIAIAIWLIQRPAPPAPPPSCPVCQTIQVADATYCVACGSNLKPSCQECGRGIELSWKHCPSCGGDLGRESA